MVSLMIGHSLIMGGILFFSHFDQIILLPHTEYICLHYAFYIKLPTFLMKHPPRSSVFTVSLSVGKIALLAIIFDFFYLIVWQNLTQRESPAQLSQEEKLSIPARGKQIKHLNLLCYSSAFWALWEKDWQVEMLPVLIFAWFKYLLYS